jgi:hypothetical protein
LLCGEARFDVGPLDARVTLGVLGEAVVERF